ncbi:hypothetical protein RJT34_31538 [Clitoria ternatea]|uniref:Uncharacterized protein n=1 Tax=Clitoria ternatea TaxID=43366 RepID=A0AAN9EUH2_CLITE
MHTKLAQLGIGDTELAQLSLVLVRHGCGWSVNVRADEFNSNRRRLDSNNSFLGDDDQIASSILIFKFSHFHHNTVSSCWIESIVSHKKRVKKTKFTRCSTRRHCFPFLVPLTVLNFCRFGTYS